MLAFMDAGDPVNRCDGKMRRSCSIAKICWLRCSVMDRYSAPREPGPRTLRECGVRAFVDVMLL